MVEHSRSSVNLLTNSIFKNYERRSVASYERDLTENRRTEGGLREALAREEALLYQRDELLRDQKLLREESDHRLLNGLQMIISLLSLQSRSSKNAEVASQLAAAADRVATIGRIHQRLHSFDGVQSFAIKQYFYDLCRDFSMMHPKRIIVVEGIEITLLAVTAIPLGFIANELITNAVKYGTGQITVSLERNSEKTYALSISDDGHLPEGFDPAGSKGLGMRIVRSLVKRIGGELRIGHGDRTRGTRFTVLFS